MSETQAQRTRNTLSRLYDDPDDRVNTLLALNPAEATVDTQRSVFRALGNTDRLRILAALKDGEKCACELQVVLDAPQSTVSTHLITLREADLIQRRRKGKWGYYRIADDDVLELLDLASGLAGGR